MADELVCMWCGHPLRPGQARWWDEKPQCRAESACNRRLRRQARRPAARGEAGRG